MDYPWIPIRHPCAAETRSYITAAFDAADKSGRIKCYAITQGQCWMSVDGVPDPTNDQETLRWLWERMMEEARGGRAGASLAAHHLAQLMLLQALRLYLSNRGPEGVGWFFALADLHLSLASRALHAAPGRRWTLDGLARVAGMSRSVFARRFQQMVGETPIAYLPR